MKRRTAGLTKALLVLCAFASGIVTIASDCYDWNRYERYRNNHREYAPEWSQDGSRIVFAHVKSIYSVSSDGTDLETVSRGKGTYGASISPSLSPDGSRVAYAKINEPLFSSFRRPDNWEIKVADLDGLFKRTRTRAKHDADDLNPAWSPDGSRIAFVSNRVRTRFFRGYIMNADGSGLWELSRKPAGSPAWSPDGKHISFANWVYTFGKTTAKLVTIGARHDIEIHSPLAWSPDSLRVAFLGWDGTKHAIYTSSIDGTELVEVREYGSRSRILGSAPKLAWSPDGSKLLHSGGKPFNVSVIELDGPGAEEPPWLRIAEHGDASWSPDGSRIAVVMHQTGGTYINDGQRQSLGEVVLFTVSNDGSDLRPLVRLTQKGLRAYSE